MNNQQKEALPWAARIQVAKFASGSVPDRQTLDALFNHEAREVPGLLELKEADGNIILNTGATALCLLITQGPVNVDLFDSNAEIGVGDDDTPADVEQTGLLSERATFKTMDDGYPIVTGRQMIFQATFNEDEAGSEEEPMDWYEWTIRNGTGTHGNICLNRRVQYLGTKAGGVWIARVTVGFA